MINAPSWRGLFLKNILSISGAEIFAFNVSPSAFTKSKFEFLSKTIKAPVLFFLRFSNALNNSSKSTSFFSLVILKNKFNFFKTDLLLVIRFEPSINKNLLISC